MAVQTQEYLLYSAMTNDRDDYSAFYRMDPSFSYWGLHCHDFFEIYIHYSGGRQMAFDNAIYDLHPNQLMIFPPFSMHGLSNARDLVNYERAYLNISEDLVRQMGLGRMDIESALRSASHGASNLFVIPQQDAERCKQILDNIARHKGDSPLDDYENLARIADFLSIVLRVIGDRKAAVPPSCRQTIMQEVLAYVNDNYTSRLTVQDLANRFNISVSYLSHSFADYTNHSIYNYIMYRRITLARSLLHSDRSLTEISSMCGFSDYSCFLKKFTSVFGQSPKSFRESLK